MCYTLFVIIMNYEVILHLFFLFIIYSLAGWTLEVIAIAIKEKKFVNRGITNGPLCPIYGIAGVLITIATHDINSTFLLFLASLIYATIIEFIAGKLLERVNKNKWWDYSHKKFNLDGYICLEYSLLWGLLGVFTMRFINPLLLYLFDKINIILASIVIASSLALIALDIVSSFISLKYSTKINKVSTKFGNWIVKTITKRLERAYPNIKKKVSKSNKKIFSEECDFYKFFAIFMIGAFLGDIIEIFFCRYTMHRFMSRSSVIWGQFSLVWGLAIAFAALLLHRYRHSSNTFLFFAGTIVGGAYEYICSVFTEFFFGRIFWDYSKLPFNINGRINLLFCFFWGFAAVIFIKGLYPKMSALLDRIPRKPYHVILIILMIFMSINLIVTGCAMTRYNMRSQGYQATNEVERLCDKYFDDEFMKQRWPNMKKPKKN